MKNIQKNFIFVHIIFIFSLILFFSLKYYKIKDLSNLFIVKTNEKKVPIFIVENNSLKRKEISIKNGDERETIEEILKVLEKNHKEALKLEYLIRNVYIDEEIYISIRIDGNNLSELTEPLFIYSIVNSINSKKKVKFINIGKEKLFKFMDEDTFFEINKAFGEL